MGDKITDWVLANMPGLTAWIGGMSELGLVALSLAFLAAVLITYNFIRCRLSAECPDYEPYEDWMDYEAWRDC